MSTQSPPEMSREEIELLLPWFVTRKLEPAEHKRVEAYLATHPDMHRQISLAEDERSSVTSDNEAMGAPLSGGLSRLMAAIDSTSASRQFEVSKLGARIQAVLVWLGSRSALVPVATAAAVVLVAQAGVIGALLWHNSLPPSKGIHVAADAKVETSGTFALAGFVPTATVEQIERALQPVGITLSDGPRAGGIYRLRLSEIKLSDTERERLLAALSANKDVIRFVAQSGP